jgi:hypothetical protein
MSVGVLWLAVAGAHDDLEDPDIPFIQQDAMGFWSGCRTVKLSGPRPRVAVETHIVKVRCRFVTLRRPLRTAASGTAPRGGDKPEPRRSAREAKREARAKRRQRPWPARLQHQSINREFGNVAAAFAR